MKCQGAVSLRTSRSSVRPRGQVRKRIETCGSAKAWREGSVVLAQTAWAFGGELRQSQQCQNLPEQPHPNVGGALQKAKRNHQALHSVGPFRSQKIGPQLTPA